MNKSPPAVQSASAAGTWEAIRQMPTAISDSVLNPPLGIRPTLEAKSPSRWFREWGQANLPTPPTDDHGLLIPDRLSFDFKVLLQHPAALVVAPPWVGKTTFAVHLDEYLRSQEASEEPRFAFGSFHHATLLENHSPGSNFLPRWWERWKASTSQACWLVDALDEGEFIEKNLTRKLLDELNRLDEEPRGRLRAVLQCRDSELPEGFFEKLKKIWPNALQAELLPLDRENARLLVGPEKWAAVLKAIQHWGLREIASYPVVLEYLRDNHAEADLSKARVWDGILKKFLEEPRPSRRLRPCSEREELFAAAARLAAVASLAGLEEIADERSGEDRPSVADFIPFTPVPWEPTRVAARDALRTRMFRRTPSGTRFLHRNVRERMTAHGMRALGRTRVNRLLVNEAGTIPLELRETARLLSEASEHPEVQSWLLSALGLPILGAGETPSSLQEAVRLLDELEGFVAKGGWLPPLNQQHTLARIHFEGLGAVVAERIRDRAGKESVRELNLLVAQAIKAPEPIAVAATIVSDPTEHPRFRVSCAYWVASAADDGTLAGLGNTALTETPASSEDAEARQVIGRALVKRQLWTAQRAFCLLSDCSAWPASMPELLQQEIVNRLAASDAPGILEQMPPASLGQLQAEWVRRGGSYLHSDLHPSVQVWLTALKTLATAEPLNDRGFDLVKRMLLELGRLSADPWVAQPDVAESIWRTKEGLQRSRAARRALFSTICESLPEDCDYLLLPPESILLGEDLDWLLERASADPTPSKGAIDSLYVLLSRDGISPPTRRKARALLGKIDAERLSKVDLRRLEERRRRKNPAQEPATSPSRDWTLEDLNRSALAFGGSKPEEKMRYLGRLNFHHSHLRFRNVRGDWLDLPENLREEVLDFCEEALISSVPTSIPEGSSFPVSISAEAGCFAAVVQARRSPQLLSAEQVKKWLPSVLVGLFDNRLELLEQCHEAQPEAVQTAVLTEAARQMRVHDNYSTLLQDLPHPLWSSTISSWLAERIADPAIPEAARGSLLRVLAKGDRKNALTLAQELLEAANEQSYVHNALLRTCLDVCLALEPDWAWPRVESVVKVAGPSLLLELYYLFGGYLGGLVVDFESWPSDRLGRLLHLLTSLDEASQAALEDESNRMGELWGPDSGENQELLRFRLFRMLWSRNDAASSEALDAVCGQHPELKKWREGLDTDQAREQFFSGPSAAADFKPLPLTEVTKSLENPNYRVIRTPDDLLETLVEQLEEIGRSVGNHLSMLYRKDYTWQREHENALRDYLQCRLSDRLTTAVLFKEPEIKYSRRNDLRVQAVVAGTSQQVGVVIEVKWSDDSREEDGISTALEGQLGAKYMKEENLTHGIFVVGYTGKLGPWKEDPSIAEPTPKDRPEPLERALGEQAERFMKANAGYRIAPVLLDLRRPPTSASRRKSRRKPK